MNFFINCQIKSRLLQIKGNHKTKILQPVKQIQNRINSAFSSNNYF